MSGYVPVIAKIKQKNDLTFALLDDTDLFGGYRAVADTDERDAIPADHRKAGMLVYSLSEGTTWRLGGGLDNTAWSEATFKTPTITLLGDVTGSPTSTKVVKINGATVPAAGSMTPGMVPVATGSSQFTYAKLSDQCFVDGTISVVKLGAGSNPGYYLQNVGGVSQWAALSVNLATQVTGVLPGSKVASDFGSQPVATTGAGSFGGDVNVDGTFSIGGKVDGVAFTRTGLGQMTSNDRQVENTPSTLTKTTRGSFADEKSSSGTENIDFSMSIPDGGVSIYNVRVGAVKADLSADDGWMGVIKIRRNGGTIVESGKTVTRLGSSTWTVDLGTFSGSALIVRCNGATGTPLQWSCEISRLTVKAA